MWLLESRISSLEYSKHIDFFYFLGTINFIKILLSIKNLLFLMKIAQILARYFNILKRSEIRLFSKQKLIGGTKFFLVHYF